MNALYNEIDKLRARVADLERKNEDLLFEQPNHIHKLRMIRQVVDAAPDDALRQIDGILMSWPAVKTTPPDVQEETQ